MKILIRGTNWIGDAVMTIPALREIRRLFPDAHITLQTRKWAEGIFRDADFLDEILAFDDADSNFRTILQQSRSLRAEKFDIAVILPSSYRSAAIVKLAGIPRRFGYSKEGRGMLLTNAIEIPKWKKERHEVFYYLNLVAEVERNLIGSSSVGDREPNIHLGVSQERVNRSTVFLEGRGLDTNRPTIAFGPGSTNSLAKRWPVARFAAVADRISEEFDANLLVLGSEQEQDVAAEMGRNASSELIDLTGATDLGEAAAILKCADLFISNDMGLAHLAAAVGTATIVMFGPTDPRTTRPFTLDATVLREPVECSPCMLRECPIDHRCMTRITVDLVVQNARRVLSENHKEPNQRNDDRTKTKSGLY